MKYSSYFLFIAALCVFSTKSFGQGHAPEAKPATQQHIVVAEKDGIEWISWDEAIKRSKTQPKKILVDIYTNWCGWCKHMDATTFRHPVVVQFVKEKYYAVKFNAETTDTMYFGPNKFVFRPEQKANELAISLLGGKMSYPSIVYLDEGFNMLSPVPGFQNAQTEEMILKYYGYDMYKQMKWEDFQQQFKPQAQ